MVLSFRFATEELTPERRAVAEGAGLSEPAPVDSFLVKTSKESRLGYATTAREHGTKWFPELHYGDSWRPMTIGSGASSGWLVPRLAADGDPRARWLWAFNLLCAIGHGVLAYLIFTACNGTRFGTVINANCTGQSMEVTIVRFSANWTSQSAGGYALSTRDNGLPIRFDLAAGWFHGLSLIFHLLVVIIGPLNRFAWLYWEQLDDAFAWWRWVECQPRSAHTHVCAHPS